jgi:beta-N-acetylhexosaminidase
MDSHEELPCAAKDYQELEEVELVPFARLSDVSPAIMTAHILFPKIDSTNCATLSHSILRGILRERLKYSGVLISDSLTMKGVLSGRGSIDEVVVEAFEAGNDILLIGGRDLQNKKEGESNIDEMLRLYQKLLQAVKSGRVKEEQVDESVQRILTLKKKAGLFDREPPTRKDIADNLRKKAHLDCAKQIAYRSVSIKKGVIPLELSQKNVAIIAPRILGEKIKGTDLIALGRATVVITYEGLEPTPEEREQILEQTRNSDYIIFCSYNAWKASKQLELLEYLAAGKPTACIASRDPYDLDLSSSPEILIATYSPTACSFQVVAEWFKGRSNRLDIYHPFSE